jgi:hypothetical protein
MAAELAFLGGTRASDSDRERAAVVLRRHYALGRLSVEELESRVSRAYDARWRSELRVLLRDLPFELPLDRGRVASRLDRVQRWLFRAHLWVYGAFNLVFVSMWAWGGGGAFFWPAFSLVPWGLLVLLHRRGSVAATRRLGAGGSPRRRRRALAA